ncbi:MAG: PhnE/PtxC family ABC transporter permease, partial [Phycisphaeraceae bacterium]
LSDAGGDDGESPDGEDGLPRDGTSQPESTGIAVALPNEPGGLGSATKWAVGLAVTAAAVLASVWVTDLGDVRWGRTFDNVSRIVSSLFPTADQLGKMDWPHLAHSFAQTLGMAVLGTLAAITWSLPLAALGAKNVAPPWLRWPVRVMLNAIRSVPSILWALVCVGAMGLGAWSGIVALAAYSTGYLTKFFYEAFESVDEKTPAALRDLGMSGVGSFVAAIWPASRLAAASSCVFMLEYNFRAASVLGVVGAGGIGYDLRLAVEWGNWHVVGVILAVLAVSVFVFDTAAGLARRALW